MDKIHSKHLFTVCLYLSVKCLKCMFNIQTSVIGSLCALASDQHKSAGASRCGSSDGRRSPSVSPISTLDTSSRASSRNGFVTNGFICNGNSSNNITNGLTNGVTNGSLGGTTNGLSNGTTNCLTNGVTNGLSNGHLSMTGLNASRLTRSLSTTNLSSSSSPSLSSSRAPKGLMEKFIASREIGRASCRERVCQYV